MKKVDTENLVPCNMDGEDITVDNCRNVNGIHFEHLQFCIDYLGEKKYKSAKVLKFSEMTKTTSFFLTEHIYREKLVYTIFKYVNGYKKQQLSFTDFDAIKVLF